MSNYAKTLPPETQKRYYDKLRDLGLTNIEKDDPFLSDTKNRQRNVPIPRCRHCGLRTIQNGPVSSSELFMFI